MAAGRVSVFRPKRLPKVRLGMFSPPDERGGVDLSAERQTYKMSVYKAIPEQHGSAMTSLDFDRTGRRGKDGLERPLLGDRQWVFAHLSDPHIACADRIPWRDLLGKRLLGRLRWILYRRIGYSAEMFSLLQDDLRRIRPQQTVVTGDLTHLSLPTEFEAARQWLTSLGAPTEVMVVPGNHDAYVETDWEQTFVRWLDYMVSDPPYREQGSLQGLDDVFPTLRIRSGVALIGVSTAHPSAPFSAVGGIGAPQLEKLAALLQKTAAQRLFRILLIHHPPIPGVVSRRKGLTDAEELYSVLSRFGTDLILHGHAHKNKYYTLKMESRSIPVIGAASVSSAERSRERVASYSVVGVTSSGDGWDVRIGRRVYSPRAGHFVDGEERRFHVP